MGARQSRWLVLLGCFLFLSPVCALGQGGTLAGRVTHAGAAVAGAEVRAESEAGRVYRALTDGSGRYAVVGLRPGSYRVEVDFRQWSAAVGGVQVEATGRVQLDFELGPGSGTQPAPVPFDLSSPAYGTRYGGFQRHELPLPRNLWRVLENLDPSVVADRFDVGGVWTGRPALIATHGSSWQETSYFFEGIGLTDPLEPGKPMLYPDYDALNELQVSTAAHDLPARAPGAAVYFSSHQAGDAWRGRLFFSFQGQGLQADNRDDDLEALGYERPWEFQNFSEFNFRGGGPLTRHWGLFFSVGTQQLSYRVPAFDATPSARVFSGLFRFDYDPDQRNHLVFLWSGQNLRSRHLDGVPFSTELVTLRERHRYQAALARWEFRPNSRTLLETHFLYAHTNLSSIPPKESTGPHRRLLFQVPQPRNLSQDPLPPPTACPGVFCANQSPALLGNSPRTRLRLGGGVTHEFPVYAGITHQVVLQGYWSGGWTSSGLMTNQDTHLLFFPGETPFGVVQWNTPVRSEQRLHEVVVAGEHRLNLRGWLFLRLGLLLDHSRASLPAQGSPPGRFAPLRSFGSQGTVIDWTNLSPRLGLTFRVGPWDTLLRASYARYYHPLGARLADFGNANALSGRFFRWNDLNGDFDFQPGEEGTLLRRFGGEFSRIDPALERPLTDEFTLGVEQRFGQRLLARVRFFRRDTKRLIETLNQGVPFSAFTPVPFLDPGEDGLPGTFDDQTLIVFNQDPATLGQDFFFLTNPGFRTSYKGFEIVLEKPLQHRWWLQASFAAGQARGPTSPGNSVFLNDAESLGGLFSADLGSPANAGFESLPHLFGTLFDNPNTLINANGRLFFDRAFTGKLAGYVRGPWDIAVSSVVKYFDGLPFARRVVVTGLNQGPFPVLADRRGDLRTQFNLSWDLRLARDFTFRDRPINFFVDIFNLLNLNNRTLENDLAGGGLGFRDPVRIQQPLVLRLGFYYYFGGRQPAVQ